MIQIGLWSVSTSSIHFLIPGNTTIQRLRHLLIHGNIIMSIVPFLNDPNCSNLLFLFGHLVCNQY
jgi:hypothetical protein